MSIIIYKTADFIIVNKPVFTPSQSDPSGDLDAMTMASSELKEWGEDDALWLVHRLDRTVGGLLVYARNKRTAAELSRQVQDGGMDKCYYAVTSKPLDVGIYNDLLFHDKRAGKAFVVDRMRSGVKDARLEIKRVTINGDKSLFDIALYSGRFHQIRVQLSHRGAPIVGDKKYGSFDRGAKSPALFAYGLSFKLFGKQYSFRALPNPKEYPWSLFATELNGD